MGEPDIWTIKERIDREFLRLWRACFGSRFDELLMTTDQQYSMMADHVESLKSKQAAPTWTQTPPTEPGWYLWWNGKEEPAIVFSRSGRVYGAKYPFIEVEQPPSGWWKPVDMTPPEAAR